MAASYEEKSPQIQWEHPFQKGGVEYQKASAQFYTRKDTERLGTILAGKLDYAPGEDLTRIVENLGGKIEYVDFPTYEESKKCGSILVHGKNDFTIILPNYTSELRDRFSIAHELGHYFLHSEQGQVPLFAERNHSTRPEWEANWFAAGFLMPETEFRKLLDQSLALSEIALYFGLSMEAVSIRKKTLCGSA